MRCCGRCSRPSTGSRASGCCDVGEAGLGAAGDRGGRGAGAGRAGGAVSRLSRLTWPGRSRCGRGCWRLGRGCTCWWWCSTTSPPMAGRSGCWPGTSSVAYAARRQGRAPGWAPLPVQYADYAIWQRELLGDEDDPGSVLAAAGGLVAGGAGRGAGGAGAAGRPAAPAGAQPPRVTARRWRSRPGCTPGWPRWPASTGVTLFMVVQAALAVLLSKLGAGDDIPVGTPVAGRTDEALDDLVGFFVNTLVLRTDLSGRPVVRGAAGPGAGVLAGRAGAPGRAVRAAGGGAGPGRGRWPATRCSRSCSPCRTTPRRCWTCPACERRRGPAGTGAARFDLDIAVGEARDAGAARRGCAGR